MKWISLNDSRAEFAWAIRRHAGVGMPVLRRPPGAPHLRRALPPGGALGERASPRQHAALPGWGLLSHLCSSAESVDV